jgi:Na+-transporting NADH:ubiquinone oxidoreductase subunit C
MSQDSAFKTIGVSAGICLFCSLFVSVSAVKLAPRQAKNRQIDKIQNILMVGDLYDEDRAVLDIYRSDIEPVMIDLSTGATLTEDQFDETLNIEAFDIKEMAGSQQYGHAISSDQDIAGIKRQPKFMLIYRVMNGGVAEKLILPIFGKGLWSTLYGFLSLEKDLQTVSGITFYEHLETPGLGGEVDNPQWKASWKGKQAFDAEGNCVIEVIKGQVNRDSPSANRQIDGLTGATLTTRGVDNLIQYWLGENGYGPFLKQLREAL